MSEPVDVRTEYLASRSNGQAPRRESQDLQTVALDGLVWETEADRLASLATLYRYATLRAQAAINWYSVQKTSIARASRLIRVVAIVLTTAGGLAPLVDASGLLAATGTETVLLGKYGYLLLGLAAACVGLDRFFGFSNTWMRYVSTRQQIETELAQFTVDWASLTAAFDGRKPTAAQIQVLIHRVKDFMATVDGLVQRETQAWITQFSTSLAELTQASARPGTEKPGAADDARMVPSEKLKQVLARGAAPAGAPAELDDEEADPVPDVRQQPPAQAGGKTKAADPAPPDQS